MAELPKLCLVVPCYNEESILTVTLKKLMAKLDELIDSGKISNTSMILPVDDGSRDRTWELIENAHREFPNRVLGLKLAANRGHQAALLAGMLRATELADAIVSLDADLQDDIEVIGSFVDEYQNGNDIVYGVRSDRTTDSVFKRMSAEFFYRMLAWMGVKTIYNHADFRLMSRRAVEALGEYREVNLYLRGLMPLIGFRQSIIFYKRLETSRPTHYPLSKMLLLAWDGITSFSVRPIRMISFLGIITLFAGVLLFLRFLYVKIFGETVPGWTSIVLLLLLFGGLQLLSIGVLGEYIAKTYMEVKARPRFKEETFLDKDGKNDN